MTSDSLQAKQNWLIICFHNFLTHFDGCSVPRLSHPRNGSREAPTTTLMIWWFLHPSSSLWRASRACSRSTTYRRRPWPSKSSASSPTATSKERVCFSLLLTPPAVCWPLMQLCLLGSVVHIMMTLMNWNGSTGRTLHLIHPYMELMSTEVYMTLWVYRGTESGSR